MNTERQSVPAEVLAGEPSAANTRTDWILGVSLLAAFSPALLNLSGQWLDAGWSRYSIVFVPLLLRCVRQGPRGDVQVWLGSLLIGLCLLAQLLAAQGGFPALGRPAMAGAIIGFLVLRGFCPLRTACLALWIVPVPSFLCSLLRGEATADFLFHQSKVALSFIGLIPAAWEGLAEGGRQFSVIPVYNGLPLLALMTGLALFAAIRQELDSRRTLRLALLLGIAGVGVHLLSVLLATTALGHGSPDLATTIVETLSWLLPTAGVIFAIERATFARTEGEDRS